MISRWRVFEGEKQVPGVPLPSGLCWYHCYGYLYLIIPPNARKCPPQKRRYPLWKCQYWPQKGRLGQGSLGESLLVEMEQRVPISTAACLPSPKEAGIEEGGVCHLA